MSDKSSKDDQPQNEGCDCSKAEGKAACAGDSAKKGSDKPETDSTKCGSKKCAGGKHKSKVAEAYAQAGKKPDETTVIDATDLFEAAEAPAKEAASGEPDYRTIAQKTAAEFDNYRKRIAREKETWKRESLADFLKEFLPAFDDLDRAIAEGEKGHSYEVVHDGAKLVRENLWKALQKAGVVPIDATGKPFDPRYHEALTMVPMPGAEPNTVVEVFQEGYMINDFVLRPARVVVAAEMA